MLYLIDGNNLLHAAHAHMPGPPVGRQRLCELLGRWGVRNATDLTVVFDGPRPRPTFERQMRAADITVIFSAPRSADEIIEEMIEQAPTPSDIHVVTGDRAIQSVARWRRCACVESADFARELAMPPPPARDEQVPQPPPEKPGAIPREETDEWLRRFEYDPDQPPDDTDLMRW